MEKLSCGTYPYVKIHGTEFRNNDWRLPTLFFVQTAPVLKADSWENKDASVLWLVGENGVGELGTFGTWATIGSGRWGVLILWKEKIPDKFIWKGNLECFKRKLWSAKNHQWIILATPCLELRKASTLVCQAVRKRCAKWSKAGKSSERRKHMVKWWCRASSL